MLPSRRYPVGTPDYLPILKRCQSLAGNAKMWVVFGVLALFLAACAVALGLALWLGYRFRHFEQLDRDTLPTLASCVLFFAIAALLCFWWASVLRLAEAFMMAFRDIARNSFFLSEPTRAEPAHSPTEAQ